MKKILLVLFIAFVVLGCAAINKAKTDFQACLDDTACAANMFHKQEQYAQVGQAVGGSSGLPFAGQVAGAVFGGIALLISGIAGGAALTKKKTEAPK